MKKTKRRYAAVLLAAMVALSGCEGSAEQKLTGFFNQYMPPITAGQTISADSAWINSEIEGAIDETTSTNLKDDFYTAVNRQWLLDTKLEKDENSISSFSPLQDIMDERLDGLLYMDAENTDGLDTAVMSKEELIHLQQLVGQMIQTAGDWEKRNEQGFQPLKPYLDAIWKIQTLDDMTAYLKNEDGKNLGMDFLVPFTVDVPITEGDTYTVVMTADAPLALQKSEEYQSISGEGIGYKGMTDEVVRKALGSLGYEEKQIQDILKKNYWFELKLASLMPDSRDREEQEYVQEHDHGYNREELEKLQGNYPLTEILDAYGLGDSETFTVLEPKYVKLVGKLYRENQLEEIKSYYMVHTILDSLELLDRESFEIAGMMEEKTDQEETDDTDDTGTEDSEKKPKLDPEMELLRQSYVMKYLNSAYQEMYIGHYCSAAEKEGLTQITKQIAGSFRQILQENEWMGEETKKKAVDKLDHMGFHILYPDHMKDYTALTIKESDTLVDMVAAVNQFEIMQLSEFVNQKVDQSNWNLDMTPTTLVNAFYNPGDNSINIIAGIVTGGIFYDENASREYNLAYIGAIIGHEITHGFDTTGYQFDQNGRQNNWWTREDEERFQILASRLAKYYGSLTPIPNGGAYNGTGVSGEAIADMGGIKSVLKMVEGEKDFNYEEFFKNYAELWRQKNTYFYENMIKSDSHPLNFLRVNVTLQQFDDFLKTFDIQPGDGMYLEKEKRILVW